MGWLCFALWLILNGKITLEIIVSGAVVSFLVRQCSKRCLGEETIPLATLLFCIPNVLFFLFVLLWEIIKANLQIIRLVLSPVIETDPCFVRLTTTLKNPTAQVVLANAITLTPGTLTVRLEGDTLLVHSLDRAMLAGLKNAPFVRQLECMEKSCVRRNGGHKNVQ